MYFYAYTLIDEKKDDERLPLYRRSAELGAYYLGACCAYGRGTQQDYAAARKFLEMADWNNQNALYLLGYLYARGLGGPEDIAKGVEYLLPRQRRI